MSVTERIINELPALGDVLYNVPKKEHHSIIKELLMIGLNVVQSSMRINCEVKGDYNKLDQDHVLAATKENVSPFTRSIGTNVVNEIHTVSKNANELSKLTKQNQQWRPFKADEQFSFKPKHNSSPKRESQRLVSKSMQTVSRVTHNPKQEVTLKVTEVVPEPITLLERHSQSQTRTVPCKHHLDDSEVRQALIYPPVQEFEAKKTKLKDLLRAHQHQEEINQEELGKLKETHFESIGSHWHKDGSKVKHKHRPRNSNSCYNQHHQKSTKIGEAESKIKMEVIRDKLKYKEQRDKERFEEGFKKYEYSDDNEMEDEEEDEEIEEKVKHSNRPQQRESEESQPKVEKEVKGENIDKKKETIFHDKHKYESQEGKPEEWPLREEVEDRIKKFKKKEQTREEYRSKPEGLPENYFYENTYDEKYSGMASHKNRGKEEGVRQESAGQSSKNQGSPEEESASPSNNYSASHSDDMSSSSFSQFSLNESRREVGKISRKRRGRVHDR